MLCLGQPIAEEHEQTECGNALCLVGTLACKKCSDIRTEGVNKEFCMSREGEADEV